MEEVYGLKNEAYGATTSGTAATIADAKALKPGAIALFNEAGDIITDQDTAQASKDFVIAANIGGDIRISKGIEGRMIGRLVKDTYQAPVMHKVIIGGTTAQTKLSIEADDVGDVIVRVADSTFSSLYVTNSVIASVYKKKSTSVEAVVDSLVAKLNANTNVPVTAAKLGSAGNFGISIESKTRGQYLSVSMQGLIEGNQLIADGSSASVLPVHGKGVGEDAWKVEFEASMYLGNSNSQSFTKEWYDAPMGVDKAGTYNTLIFQEELRKPYIGETNVKPLYVIYLPVAATATLNTLESLLQYLMGKIDIPEVTP